MRRKKGFKIALITLLAALMALSVFVMPSFALESWPGDCYVASEGACLMDADSKTVLFSKDAYSPYYPASITKVMTALVVLENCDNLSEQVVFSYDAVHIEEENSTVIGASEGDSLSVLDSLYCLLFQSANEVANALAEHVGAKHAELKEGGMSDRDVFILMMNMKAEELGCTGSHFNNPSGLTDPDHYVTAYDMCLILAEAVKNETFLDIESHTYWTHAPIARYPDADDPWNTVYPKHSMLKRNNSLYYDGAIAGKTGYTITAGNTLVTAAKREGMTLVTCVLNAHSNHYNDTKRLLDFGFDNFTSLLVSDYDNLNETILGDFSIGDYPLVDSYTIGMDQDTRVAIPKSGNFTEVERSLEITRDEEGGTATAEVIYTYGERIVGKAAMKLVGISDNTAGDYAEADPLLRDILNSSSDTGDGTISENPAEAAEDDGERNREGTVFGAITDNVKKFAPPAIAVILVICIISALLRGRRNSARRRRRDHGLSGKANRNQRKRR